MQKYSDLSHTVLLRHPKIAAFLSQLLAIVCIGVAAVTDTATAQPATGASAPTPAQSAIRDLQRDLNDILQDPNFSNATWGVSIQSLENGEFIYRLNETKSLLPASNFKLFTAAEALSLLGPEFRYSTQLLSTGKVSDKTLHGDLVIRGSGDPSFGSPSMNQNHSVLAIFEAWADSLLAMGIEQVDGSIIGDDSYFTPDVYPKGWAIEDEPYYYAMQSSALSFAENQVSVSVTPSAKAGVRANYELYPMSNYFTVENRGMTKADSLKGKTARGRDTVLQPGATTLDITRDFGSNNIIITGDIPVSGSAVHEQLSVENPALYTATLLREVLEEKGIEITGRTTTQAESRKKLPYLKMRVLAQYTSPTVAEIVSVMNKESNNMFAEQLFRTIGKETAGEGSWTKGIEAMKKYLGSIGIAPDRVSIFDGSGLSRMDLVSAGQINTLLEAMYRRQKLFGVFYPSLSIMGVDGTLANRLRDTRAQGNVHAKTGFVTGVRSIAGYLTTKDNEMLAFTIIGNNFTVPVSLANNLQDLILLRLVNFSRK